MLAYLARRAFYGVLSLVGASILIFVVARLSGDPTGLMLPYDATPEMAEELRAELGLDHPLYVQYWSFLTDALQGDFGRSYHLQLPVTDLILQRVPPTLQLASAALVFSVAIAVPLGVIAAVRRGTWVDTVAKTVALLGQAMPNFWLGLLLILVFATTLQWLPAYGNASLWHLVLPAVALGWYPAAAQTRIIRSSMIDVLDSDYIRMGRAVGIPESALVWKYGLRNALIELVTMLGVYFAAMLGGAFVVEAVFAWPGLGRTVVQAVFARDFPIVQGGVMFAAFIFVTAHLLVDLSYSVIDPRIRHGG